MNPQASFCIPPQVLVRELGDETVILDLAAGAYFGLDGVGTRLWQLLAAGQTCEAMCRQLLEEYEVSRAVLEADMDRLLNELLARHLIAQRPDQGSA